MTGTQISRQTSHRVVIPPMFNIPVINQQLQPAAAPSPDKALLIYASAHWCGPCRAFTPILKGFYENAKALGLPLEIIFLSSDRSEREMVSYYKESHGSWLAVPFFAQERQMLSSHFNIRGIPTLVLLNRGTNQATEVDARMLVQQGAMGGTSDRIKSIVHEMRERSGAILFDSIPRALNTLTSQQTAGVCELLTKLIGNIADHPTESKYRQVKGDNATIRKSILDLPCGDAPLRAIGFGPDSSGTYNFRPSLTDPVTIRLVLQNRESNGLSIRIVAAPVGSARPVGPTVSVAPTQPAKELKFRVLFREMAPQTTDSISSSESLDVIKTITESICDVPGEYQQLFCSSIKPQGPLTNRDVSVRLNMATTPSLDLLVMGQHTTTNPVALAETDEEAHKYAQKLRSQLTSLQNQFMLSEAIHAQLFEVPSNQEKALEAIPVSELHAMAIARLRRAIPIPDTKVPPTYEECLFVELMDWFKTKFFTWTDKPKCTQCGANGTTLVNGTAPATAEEAKGLASRVEVYSCTVCGTTTRFPRFNHPVALLATRTGRCGEWANCFTLIARAVGFEMRKVFDSADHVWTEVWMEHRQEWVHADPCENAYDKPMLYSVGWGKGPTPTHAVSKDGIADVTLRYTPKKELIPQPKVSEETICSLNELLMKHWADISGSPGRFTALKSRSKQETEALKKLVETDRSNTGNLGGRTTGSVEWRSARGELGNCVGGVHADTVSFSDEKFLEGKKDQVETSKITVWDDGKLITGIQCEYKAVKNGELFKGSCHASSGEKVKETILDLNKGDRVTHVSVRTGDLVDYIKLETKMGKSIACGNPAGGDARVLVIPEGERLVGFQGGLGGHIHNIGILTAPMLPRSKASPEDVTKMREIYASLVKEGMEPNMAALEALKRVRY